MISLVMGFPLGFGQTMSRATFFSEIHLMATTQHAQWGPSLPLHLLKNCSIAGGSDSSNCWKIISISVLISTWFLSLSMASFTFTRCLNAGHFDKIVAVVYIVNWSTFDSHSLFILNKSPRSHQLVTPVSSGLGVTSWWLPFPSCQGVTSWWLPLLSSQGVTSWWLPSPQ